MECLKKFLNKVDVKSYFISNIIPTDLLDDKDEIEWKNIYIYIYSNSIVYVKYLDK